MVAQRRYSVTGQTPPDDAEAMKARSPKLQALDTNVPPTGCGLCECGAETSFMAAPVSEDGGAEAGRGRKMGQAGTVVRTSSKRSATQLPSPSSPTQCLPPKMARYRLAHHDDYHMDLDTDTDVDSEATDDHSACASHAASTPESSLPFSLASLPDAPRLEQLQLCAEDGTDGTDDDYGMEDFALSPSHSRNHSLDRISFDEKHELQASWDAYQKAALLRAELETIQIEQIEQLETEIVIPASHTPLTFLTLPPEIRHQIYRNCDNIVLHKPLVYCISTFQGEMQHPLASVSRLVRAEALAIFYSYNLWVIKVEFRIMYDAFQDWIIRLGSGAGLLRLVNFSVRGSLFKPRRTHTQSVMVNGQLVHVTPGAAAAFDNLPNLYSPPDGDASFHIDLSEKYIGGKVELMRNDGTLEAGEKATAFLGKLVNGLWEKRRTGTLNGQDWISMVDGFISFVGGW